MSFEPIGFLTIAAGLACVWFGPSIWVGMFLSFTLLGAAAAAFLPALGGANIQPAHLLLLFLFADLMLRPDLALRGLSFLSFPKAGFWLLLMIVYGLAITAIMPRLFAGATYVFATVRLDNGASSIVTLPLAPTTSNLTQTVYLILDGMCFLVFSAFATRERAAEAVARGAILCGCLNLAFAAADLITFYTNTSELLAPIRNSSYRLIDDAETAGFKRIVGSFTEAAAFAFMTLGLLAFNLRLWNEGIASRWTGPIAILSVVALLFGTSTTGYIGLSIFLALQVTFAIGRLLAGRAAANTVLFICITPVICAVAVAGIMLNPDIRATVSQLVEVTLFNKLSSESGIERGAWNRQAIAAIQDTMWLGAGIGSLRASSWLVAVPASIGAIGACLYGAFILTVLGDRRGDEDHLTGAVRAAARDACLALIIAASIAGSFIDLGLCFFLFAALAVGLREPSRRSQPSTTSAHRSTATVGSPVGRPGIQPS